MKCLLIRTAVIVLVAAGAGVGYARYRGKPLIPDVQQIVKHDEQRKTWAEETAISLEEFKQHYEAGQPVIDARARDVFAEGHLDAPLIMNIPAGEAQDGYHMERVMPYKGLQIVLYCASESCEDAETLWKVLQSWGFGPEVRVYHAGWRGIQEAHLPTATGPDPYGYPPEENSEQQPPQATGTDTGSTEPDTGASQPGGG